MRTTPATAVTICVKGAMTAVVAMALAAPSGAAERMRGHAEENRAMPEKPELGGSKTANPSHIAHEGDVTRQLWIDTSRVAEFPAEGGRPAIRQAEPGEIAEANRTSKQGPKDGDPSTPGSMPADASGAAAPSTNPPAALSPVFLDASGNPRALPGGVIVSLKEPLPEAQARGELEAAGLQPVRRIGERMWMVESPAGIASLELANRLHETGRFEFVQPNWWKPRTTK
jgi:hypothetical protein